MRREPELQVKEPDGQLVAFTEKGRMYLMEENVGTDDEGEPIHSYMTVIGKSSLIYKDSDGFIQEYDNTLFPIEGKEEEMDI